jgi:5-methylcytosine-specific restriction endonuclease McrBC GTP-binding regulatory subunit McrB
VVINRYDMSAIQFNLDYDKEEGEVKGSICSYHILNDNRHNSFNQYPAIFVLNKQIKFIRFFFLSLNH